MFSVAIVNVDYFVDTEKERESKILIASFAVDRSPRHGEKVAHGALPGEFDSARAVHGRVDLKHCLEERKKEMVVRANPAALRRMQLARPTRKEKQPEARSITFIASF